MIITFSIICSQSSLTDNSSTLSKVAPQSLAMIFHVFSSYISPVQIITLIEILLVGFLPPLKIKHHGGRNLSSFITAVFSAHRTVAGVL